MRAYKLFELGGTIYGAFTPAQKAVNVAAQNVQNEVNAYIESKGITVDDSMTPDNSSWGLRIARSQTDLNNGYTLKSCKSEVDFVISDYKNANGFNPTSMYCYYDNSYFYILFW